MGEIVQIDIAIELKEINRKLTCLAQVPPVKFLKLVLDTQRGTTKTYVLAGKTPREVYNLLKFGQFGVLAF